MRIAMCLIAAIWLIGAISKIDDDDMSVYVILSNVWLVGALLAN